LEGHSNLSFEEGLDALELMIKLIETDIKNEIEVRRLVKSLRSINEIIITLLRNNGGMKNGEILERALKVRRNILKRLGERVNGTYLVAPATLMTLVDICNILYNGIEEGKIALKEWISKAMEGNVDDDPVAKVNVDIVKCITALNGII